MSREHRDSIDQLEYEDTALERLLRAIGDERRNINQHGRCLKIFVERLAVRQAARESTAQALASVPGLVDVADELDADLVQHRLVLDHLDDMTRQLAPTNVNQGQNVDAAVAEITTPLLAEIDRELTVLIPEVRHRLDERQRRRVLPSAGYVLRHCPLHPGAHTRRWYDRVGLFVWVHAVYDYLRSLPIGGIKPRRTISIPGEGVVPLSTAGQRTELPRAA